METSLNRRELLTAFGGLALANHLPTYETEKSMSESSASFQLGLITYNVPPKWDLDTLLHHAKAAGYAGLELRTTHAHGVEVSLNAEQRKEVKRKFEEAGVRLWGFGTVCEFHSPDPSEVKKQIESCKAWCQLAQDIGVKGVKVRPNGLPKEVPVEKTLEQIGKALVECGKSADEHGVEIWVEVHGAGTAHPPHIKTIMDACQHPKVGICWNSNPQDLENGSIKTYFDLLQPYLRSCHINDLWNPHYPYRELFALLQKSGYKGLTLCEVAQPMPPDAGLTFLHCYKALWEAMQPE